MFLIWLFLFTVHAQAPEGSRYALVGDSSENQTHCHEAITPIINEFNFAIRSIVRGRLETALTPCNQYQIEQTPTHFKVQCDNKTPVIGNLDGTVSSYTNNEGKLFSVTTRHEGSATTLMFQGEAASQESSFSFSEDEIHVTKVINSPYFETLVSCSFNYRRSP